jgi:dihydroorotase
MRLMVHITEPGVPLDGVFDLLRPGDIVTHLFHGRAETIVGADGRVLASARRARERGVRMDIGHGGGSFTFATARAALADGFEPDTISTDLHTISIAGACRDLPTTMAKFVALGMPLERVVAAVTVEAARSIEHPDVTGTLALGSAADIAIFDEIEGPATFEDVVGERIDGHWSLRPWLTIRAGRSVDSMPGAAAPR